MLTSLPKTPEELMQWTWPPIEPHYRDLASRTLTAGSVSEWLAAWSRLREGVSEMQSRLSGATTVNTADVEAGRRHTPSPDMFSPGAQSAERTLKQRLLDSGLEP